MAFPLSATRAIHSRSLWSTTVCAWLLLLLAGSLAWAEGPVQSILQLSEYQKQDWQVEDGLPENNVRMIAQRPDGMLLLATSSGLSTFDGLHFQDLSVPGKAGEA